MGGGHITESGVLTTVKSCVTQIEWLVKIVYPVGIAVPKIGERLWMP